jgi:hypothetical protein
VGIWYATREDVQRALDAKDTARSNAQIDRAIESASRMIDGSRPGSGLLLRRFYPELRTMTFDWPNNQYARPWRLWLDANELISATTVTAGGTTIAATDYFLRPDSGPPYTHIEIDLDSSAAFSAGDTHQRSISILGVYGFSADDATAGTLAEALDASETAVDVSDSSTIGVGSIIKVESERMIVTGKTMMDTGVNIDAADSLTALNSDVSITMSTTTSAPVVDEVILIDSERMLVVDIAGSVLTVKRPWDGTVLATHAANADIYAPRRLTVTRGALGTTAATHADTTAITRHVFPGLVQELCVAEALNHLMQERSGYARTVGSGENQREASGRGLRQIRDDARNAYGRRARLRAV